MISFLLSGSYPFNDLPKSIGFLNDYNWFINPSLAVISKLIIPAFYIAMIIAWLRMLFLGDSITQNTIMYRSVIILFVLTIYPYLFGLANNFVVSLTDTITADSNDASNASRVKIAVMAINRMEQTYSGWDSVNILKMFNAAVWRVLAIKFLLFLTNAAIYIVFKVREYLLAFIYVFLPYIISLSIFDFFSKQAKRLAHAAMLLILWYFIYSILICMIFPVNFCFDVIHMSSADRKEDVENQSKMILKMFFLLIVSICLPLLAAFLYGTSVAGVEAAIPAAAIIATRAVTRSAGRFIHSKGHHFSRNTLKSSSAGNPSSSANNSYTPSNVGSSSGYNVSISNSNIPSTKLSNNHRSFKGV